MNICKDIYNIIISNIDKILMLRDKKKLKWDKSYVTEGDLLCQELIVKYINDLDEDFEILSEEIAIPHFIYDKEKKYIIIDPIDGTENFTSGLKEWGVSICVYKRGIHSQSMVALPELKIRLISGDNIIQGESRIYGLSSSLSKEDLLNLKPGFEYRIIGCCVYNMYNVIKGSFSIYENFKGAYVWDIIAGLNLAIENNLSVTVNGETYNGEFLQPDRKYCFKVYNK
ncbi:MAG: inositol monophosphatase [Bacteroidetes bacterium]|nr:inositol monophosphatase [Bacteroidota bacterium]